ncbi:MAG TPA: twin-arginine translocation signal domain-containing protein [Candidatus Acidoferrum sp.]|jgi:hypothetical protein|nr:twin-arginine translocation signal domain-containing protein [Candidatus Acidoferrum sp.]
MKEVSQQSAGFVLTNSERKNAKTGSNRRSFLKKGIAAGAVTVGAGLLASGSSTFAQEEKSGHLTKGDAAILRFLAAAEILESDLWLQYQELAGTQDDEVSTLASKLIPGYPSLPTGGSPLYANAIAQLDSDMAQYIHDNTEDELSHEVFINAYLASKGADTVSLDQFRTLPSSKATGANQFGRLTNLTQLSVDTSWWTRYRSRTQNPDFGDTFPQAIPTLAVGQHTAIPRTDADISNSNHLQAIANTAGFHFGTIEQGGSSLYPSLAQRVTHPEVLRIVLAIGGTEIMHFQTWSDKAGNAPDTTDTDPITGAKVVFDLASAARFSTEDFKSNLIMPEPTVFLSKNFPTVSIIRPTETQGAAMGALKALTADGLFIGQSKEFFAFLTDLAEDADAARRG